MTPHQPILSLTVAGLLALCGPVAHAERIQLASGGAAHLVFSPSKDASKSAEASARRLLDGLSAITGASFTEDRGSGEKKIVLALGKDYPDLLPPVEKDETSTWKERYRLLSKDGNLYIIGETDLALAHGVADLLHRVGYRHLLPPKAWIVTPSTPDLSIDVDVLEQPKYASRLLFMASSGKTPIDKAARYRHAESDFGAWRRHMRAFSAFRIRSGHAWIQMARRNEGAFVQNPQWIVPGSPDFRHTETDRNFKFNLENDDLVALLQKDSLQWLRDNPDSDTVSVDPSDGANWPKESPIGSPSDQVVYLANAVSKAIREEFPEKKVAFYAYHLHSPPPRLELEKGVIVNVATGFIRGGYTIAELMKSWHAKGAELGIRDYTNVFFGSWDLPGGSYHAFSPEKTYNNLRRYYQDGARYWISETDNAWGAIGLGAYVAFHTLWDPVNGPGPEELVNDFIEKAFGNGAEAMHRYFKIVAPESHPIVSEDLAARMYGALNDALQADLKPEERTRVLHLVTYVRFVELMHAFRNAEPGKPEEESYRPLAQWAYDCRDIQMFSSRGVLNHCVRKKPKLIAVRDEVLGQECAPPSEDDLAALLQERLGKVKRIGFQPITYPARLTPIKERDEEKLKSAKNFAFAQAKRLIWLAKKEGEVFTFEMRNLGSRPTPPPPTAVSLKLMDDVFNESAVDLEIPADTAEWQKVELKAPVAGQYEIALLTHGGYIELRWDEGLPVVMPSGQVGGSFLNDVWDACFYVPKNIDRVAGYSDRARGVLLSESGEILHDFTKESGPSYFDIAIPPSGRGRVYRFQNAVGRKILMTVPPYFARRGSELLIPVEEDPAKVSTRNQP